MSATDAQWERRVRELERQIQQIPSRWAQPAGPYATLKIIGGNTISGFDCIAYGPSAVPGGVYDPNSPPSPMPTGLGTAWLTLDGNLATARRVLVRHQWSAFPYPLIAGDVYRAAGSVPLTSGATTMTFYVPDFG